MADLGQDVLAGFSGPDHYDGGDGADELGAEWDTHEGDDIYHGHGGNDAIHATDPNHAERVYGGTNHDFINVQDMAARDRVRGGKGVDICAVDPGDVVSGCEHLTP